MDVTSNSVEITSEAEAHLLNVAHRAARTLRGRATRLATLAADVLTDLDRGQAPTEHAQPLTDFATARAALEAIATASVGFPEVQEHWITAVSAEHVWFTTPRTKE